MISKFSLGATGESGTTLNEGEQLISAPQITGVPFPEVIFYKDGHVVQTEATFVSACHMEKDIC